MKKQIPCRISHRGFTLIEIMIALAISGILLIGLPRLYSITLNSYSLQEQLTEMNQNAKFVITELSDVIMQAGADCAAINTDSLDKDTIITPVSASDFYIRTNPKGGLDTFTTTLTLNTTTSCSLQVIDAKRYNGADSVGKIPKPGSATGFVRKYKLIGVNLGNNKICIGGGCAPDVFSTSDAIYAFKSNHYYLSGTNLCLDSNSHILAENIDSLKISFYTKAGADTTNWRAMWSARVVVEATTSAPDGRYKGYADHKRRLKLTNEFRLKNRIK
jgi:prepilin-type N-terminal cleavage/methylation domain-containing protein